MSKRRILVFWKELYSQYVNNIDEVWNENTKQELFLQFEEEKRWNTNILREHLDMVREVEEVITPMDLIESDRSEVANDIKRLKNKKAAGPNKIKGEFYIEVANSEFCLYVMTKCLNKAIIDDEKPESWKIPEPHLLIKNLNLLKKI